jgi:hypothetical protein
MSPQFASWWSAFENSIAGFYRTLGALKVQQNVNLAGNEIDIYVEEQTPSGQAVRTAIECKYYSRKVPKSVVLQFAHVVAVLRNAELIDKAVMVAYKGFTPNALSLAQAANIELLTFNDIKTRVSSYAHGAVPGIIKQAEEIQLPDSFPELVFVIMPFSEKLEDIYLYGIRGCIEKFNLKCKRADELQHDNEIIKEVIDHIKRARIIIAEVSDHNPNVFYEVGWAHALRRETVLIARENIKLPFDIQHINTIFYHSIKDLENKLSLRIKAILKDGT